MVEADAFIVIDLPRVVVIVSDHYTIVGVCCQVVSRVFLTGTRNPPSVLSWGTLVPMCVYYTIAMVYCQALFVINMANFSAHVALDYSAVRVTEDSRPRALRAFVIHACIIPYAAAAVKPMVYIFWFILAP